MFVWCAVDFSLDGDSLRCHAVKGRLVDVDGLCRSTGIVDVNRNDLDRVGWVVIELEFTRDWAIGVLVEAGLARLDGQEVQDSVADSDAEAVARGEGVKIRERLDSILEELSKLDGSGSSNICAGCGVLSS